MTTVYKYQIYCETEAVWKNTWGTEDEAPTTCPTNTAHTVNLSSVAIVQRVSQDDVTIHQPTQGRFMVESFPVPIDATSPPGEFVTYDLVFKNKFLLWTTGFNCKDDMVGDCFDVIINPDTTVGGLTATGNISDIVLNVSPTVTDNVTVGMYLRITNLSANPPETQDLGKICTVDGTAGTVEISNPLTTTYPPGSIIQVNVYLAKGIILDFAGPMSLSEKGFQGKVVPPNTTFRMVYKNSNGVAKSLNWRVGYYYGADFTDA